MSLWFFLFIKAVIPTDGSGFRLKNRSTSSEPEHQLRTGAPAQNQSTSLEPEHQLRTRASAQPPPPVLRLLGCVAQLQSVVFFFFSNR